MLYDFDMHITLFNFLLLSNLLIMIISILGGFVTYFAYILHIQCILIILDSRES